MSIPKDHHYLPKFYLERWATDGKVVRYVRPLGADGKLDCKWKSPTSIAYQENLYHLPDIQDPLESQHLEFRFFQQIDDRAAKALQKLDASITGTSKDRVALAQFMISLLHRSPSRLAQIRAELEKRTADAPYRDLDGDAFENAVKATANRLLASLVESDSGTKIVAEFKIFKVQLSDTKRSFMTSDRPITVSAQLISPDAFMIMPYAPDRLVILAKHEAIATSFSSQNADVLVTGINTAVVEQSEDIIIAKDKSATRMIDRLFMRPAPDRIFDGIGLIRRNSPLRDMNPKVRQFSRHKKNEMKYLGS